MIIEKNFPIIVLKEKLLGEYSEILVRLPLGAFLHIGRALKLVAQFKYQKLQ